MTFKYLVSVTAFILAFNVHAQPAFYFSYDNSGNRILRQVIDLSDPPGEVPGGLSEALAAADDEEEQEIHNKRNLSDSDLPKLELGLFPNPVQDYVFLQVTHLPEGETAYWQLWTINGQPHSEQQSLQKEQKISLRGSVPGHYLLVVTYGTQRDEWLIVKD